MEEPHNRVVQVSRFGGPAWRTIRLQRTPRWRVRLQAGFSQPCRAAVAPGQQYRKQPHAKQPAVAGKDGLGPYLTRRANQRHSFIIAKSVNRPWARNGAPFGVMLGENLTYN